MFVAQIETSIITKLDAHAPQLTSTKLPKTERWYNEHIDELEHRQRHFECKYRHIKSNLQTHAQNIV